LEADEQVAKLAGQL